MAITTVSPEEAQRLVQNGARLIDIRERDEFARAHIPGAVNTPLIDINSLTVDGRTTVFHCRSGMRTSANAAQLEATAGSTSYIIEGGLDAWRKAGLAVTVDRKQPLELMRQVQLIAGSLVLLGVILGYFIAPGFYIIAAFVGAGLTFAGATGWCGMALLLRHMPWNRQPA